MKTSYKVTDVEYDTKTSYLSWRYGGKEYWAQGEFHIDDKGVLHHTFCTPSGKEKEVRIKVY